MKYFRQTTSVLLSYGLEEYRDNIGKYQRADLAFQANKFSRWDAEQMSDYLQSLTINCAPSSFIFADVDECLKAAIKSGKKKDIKYFQKWKNAGVKYLNIDSNNRNNVIVLFIQGEVKLPHGTYTFGDAEVVVDKDNDTYETLDPIVKDAFDSANISVVMYQDLTRRELSILFTKVNDGKPLNSEELLNAYITEVANVIRELAGKYEDYFADSPAGWFTGSSLNRRGIDGFIAHCAAVFCYSLDHGSSMSEMRNFYREGSDGEQKIHKFKNIFTKFMSDVMTKNAYAIANRNSIFDLFVIYTELKNRDLKIEDNEKFLKEYIRAVSELLEDKKLHENPKWKDPKSFGKMVGGRQVTNNKVRNELIKKKMDIDSVTIQIDSKRSYTKQDRQILASKYGFKTPEGKDIVMSELHTSKYHGGHILPHAEGNETSLDNGVIQESEDNKKLGKNPVKFVDTVEEV